MSACCYLTGRVTRFQPCSPVFRASSTLAGLSQPSSRSPAVSPPSLRARALSFSRKSRSVMASASKEEEQSDPENFAYTHLWVSKDGETHIHEAKLTDFDLKKFAAEPQFVKAGFKVTNLVFTELAPGLMNDYHPCPSVQFVICVGGSWFVKTTDGTKKTMKAGDILFQDNNEACPSDKPPSHFSGVEGDQPCQQVVIQVDRKPEVDNPGSL